MLFNVLKLFGLDVPAKIAEVRAEFERRVELAKGRVRQTLTTASILALIFVLAGLAALAAIGIGLSALYSWIAINYGQFYGYAAVGGLLIIVSGALLVTGILQAKSLSSEPSVPHVQEGLTRGADKEKLPRAADEAGNELSAPTASAADMELERAVAHQVRSAPLSVPANSEHRLFEPLSLILSKFIKLPITGNPAVDDAIQALRGPANDVAEDAIRSAADMIRYGEREKLLAALGAAVFMGWILERIHSGKSVQQARSPR